MSLMFFAIEKEVAFQGKTERWSNVYCYDTPASDAAAYTAIVNGLVAAERPVHSTSVQFRLGRAYTTNGLNVPLVPGSMYHVQDLSGTFGSSGSASIYRECAFLVKWPLPRKGSALTGLGPPRALKKWIHSCSALGGSGGALDGSAVIGTIPTNTLTTYAAAVSEAVDGSPLSSPDGTPNSATAQVHQYLEHRQFPRGRKEYA